MSAAGGSMCRQHEHLGLDGVLVYASNALSTGKQSAMFVQDCTAALLPVSMKLRVGTRGVQASAARGAPVAKDGARAVTVCQLRQLRVIGGLAGSVLLTLACATCAACNVKCDHDPLTDLQP